MKIGLWHTVAITLALSGWATAGPVPLPLDGELDLAQTIVLGKIVSLKDASTDSSGVEKATATIEVQEVLKGPKDAKTLDVPVATLVPKEAPAAEIASLPRTYKKGDEGIWVIMPGGELSACHGLQKATDRKLVQDALADVERRFWATPANGLAAWAGLSKFDSSLKGQLMFAVKNVSKVSIYLPSRITRAC